MSGWSCAHEVDGMCTKVRGFACDPTMKGCVLYGKVKRKGNHLVSISEGGPDSYASHKPSLTAEDIRRRYSETGSA